ncbi:hypothetical protein BpHYR1_012362 [Brachionus plicatilis]|uniref:Uncharacterized protein n=1 Tax=Brachionus plicatilis TaxID=10195 RepID=A0A3M7S1F4_BRAPC|nr:hypothetical protein BpHYR1_012362 [Brachionus plicatilis]
MKRKSKSSIKKNSKKKVVSSNFDSKTDTLNEHSDKISVDSSQDNYRLLIDESVSNDFSQESLSNFPIISTKKYIFIQLKLTSVDASCLYDKLDQNFLCISSDACASHVKAFIYKKMKVSQSLYDVVLMSNGYEIKSKCPISVLKNNFFADKLDSQNLVEKQTIKLNDPEKELFSKCDDIKDENSQLKLCSGQNLRNKIELGSVQADTETLSALTGQLSGGRSFS